MQANLDQDRHARYEEQRRAVQSAMGHAKALGSSLPHMNRGLTESSTSTTRYQEYPRTQNYTVYDSSGYKAEYRY